MRLLHVRTNKFAEFMHEDHLPEFAILSHTWGRDEPTYQQILKHGLSQHARSHGIYKIRQTCDQARSDGLEYCWVDTCCIDKTSSAELSEAINSMYRWYAQAKLCYAYLSDVTVMSSKPSDLGKSRWFTRGWTLQEMIAPTEVRFYGSDWTFFGARSWSALAIQIAKITGIDEDLLRGRAKLGSFCVARRMSWAARRETTRVEDRAYSLLGIFDVNMPLLYGEGSKAFYRLQEQIIRTSGDDSLLAWEYYGKERPAEDTLFAPSPLNFIDCRHFAKCRPTSWTDILEVTNNGIRLKTHYISEIGLGEINRSLPHPNQIQAALLNCFHEKYPHLRFALRTRVYQTQELDQSGYFVYPQESNGLDRGLILRQKEGRAYLTTEQTSADATVYSRLTAVDRHGGLSAVSQSTHLITRMQLEEKRIFKLHVMTEPADRLEIVDYTYNDGFKEAVATQPDPHSWSYHVEGVAGVLNFGSSTVLIPFKVMIGVLRIIDKESGNKPFVLVCDYQADYVPPYNSDDGQYGVALYDDQLLQVLRNYQINRYDGRTPRRRAAELKLLPDCTIKVSANLTDFEGVTMVVKVTAVDPKMVPSPMDGVAQYYDERDEWRGHNNPFLPI